MTSSGAVTNVSASIAVFVQLSEWMFVLFLLIRTVSFVYTWGLTFKTDTRYAVTHTG